MTIQLLSFIFGVPVVSFLFNLFFFVVSKKLSPPLAENFEEITQDWVNFFNKGIPIPADHKRIEGSFVGEPVLVQPVFQKQIVPTRPARS
ncbi:MAG: hypothetical protein ACE5F7_09950 [Nitrospiria bacterium]